MGKGCIQIKKEHKGRGSGMKAGGLSGQTGKDHD